ncbi:MAG: phosphopantothenoylcysteine decarboxylase [Sedimentisphaerales bacterium]|nr:phosphopantothenoylcysteine decarboxylase [Sedimentisphaerales bacterium]
MASVLGNSSVLLGVTGGVAAYKAVGLAGKLTAAGAKVNCIMTESACEFIRPKSFEAVTHQEVFTSMWQSPKGFDIGHINLRDLADVIVVAPATANIIGKVAGGICDDLLSTALCACWNKKVLIAPAMNTNMWSNPAVQKNIQTLKEMNFEFIGPESGRLACGTEGPGRMSEPKQIIKAIENLLSK